MRLGVVVLAVLVLASCGGGSSTGLDADGTVDAASTTDAPTDDAAPEEMEVVQFTWTTSYVGDGYGATVEGAIAPTGTAAEGEARWGLTYTYEPDGVDGVARGEVSWHTTAGTRPDDLPPGSSIDAERVSAAMR